MARALLTIAFLGFCAALLSSIDGTKARAEPIHDLVLAESEYIKKLQNATQLSTPNEFPSDGGRKLLQTAREDAQLAFVAVIVQGNEDLFERGLELFEDDLDFEIEIPDSDGTTATPLEAAIVSDNPDFVEALIKAGADPNTRSSGAPSSPLYLAIFSAGGEVISSLAEGGADLNEVVAGGTPLFLAAALGKKEAVEALLDAGADPSIPGQSFTAEAAVCACADEDFADSIAGFEEFCEFDFCDEDADEIRDLF